MLLIDANIILRYVLNDHADLSPKAKDIILNHDVLILTQVVAEVIYVLGSVYKTPKEGIVSAIAEVYSMENVALENAEIVKCALDEFGKTNLDFVDVLLYAHQKLTGETVATFDKKLNAKLSELSKG